MKKTIFTVVLLALAVSIFAQQTRKAEVEVTYMIANFMNVKTLTVDAKSEREAEVQGYELQARGAVYTFSGDQFTVTATNSRTTVSGTVKIKDNLLYLVVNDEEFGIFYVDFLPENNFFYTLFGFILSYLGDLLLNSNYKEMLNISFFIYKHNYSITYGGKSLDERRLELGSINPF